MITALAFVATSLLLSLVLLVASLGKRESQSEEVHVFHYPSGTIRMMGAFVSLPALTAFAIYLVSRRPPSQGDVAIYGGLGMLGTVIYLICYRYVRSYRVEVSDSGIRVMSIGRERTLSFSEVQDACLAKDGKGLRTIRLRSKADPPKRLDIHSTISNFDVLADLLGTRLATQGVALGYRDAWGRRS